MCLILGHYPCLGRGANVDVDDAIFHPSLFGGQELSDSLGSHAINDCSPLGAVSTTEHATEAGKSRRRTQTDIFQDQTSLVRSQKQIKTQKAPIPHFAAAEHLDVMIAQEWRNSATDHAGD
jgi:hypothetical protein